MEIKGTICGTVFDLSVCFPHLWLILSRQKLPSDMNALLLFQQDLDSLNIRQKDVIALDFLYLSK